MLIVLFLLIVGAYSVIKIPAVQSWCVNRVTNVLSNKLGAEVNVGSVDIDFFTKLVLNDLYVEDEKEDTLITIQQLTADFNVFSFGDKYFDASSIDLYNANLRMKKRKGETHSNLKFITDYLKSSKPDSLKEDWDFEIESVS
ncbi:MAG: hypothetical protein HKN75_01270, partial [Bacteroidia bacterium]|nr:hypothetical protein [Bacteroidia bacterium]